MVRLAVRVRREQAELVLAELLELAPSGVEEVSIGDAVTEYAIYGASGELPSLPSLTAAAGGALIEIRSEELADDWAERWRQFHQPVVIEGALTVRPPWCPAATTPVDLVIDPGQAFGTGAHATTRLCLELMLRLAREAGGVDGGFLDLGCGSGVLAIAAARLGWAPVLALDIDPASVRASARNAQRNAVEVKVRRYDLRRRPPPPARTVVANLLRPLLLELAGQLRDAARPPPERLIAGGLLVEECDEVSAALASCGLLEAERRGRGEWGALLFAPTTRG